MSKVYGFNEAGFRRVRDMVRRSERTPVVGAQRRRRTPVVGGGSCPDRDEMWAISIKGFPTGGTFDMDVTVLGTKETLTFNWDDTAAEVKTELETHTKIASGDVAVAGGPFPGADITITFEGDLASHEMKVRPDLDFSSLTGGSGVGVDLSRWTPGYPKDGSVAP